MLFFRKNLYLCNKLSFLYYLSIYTKPKIHFCVIKMSFLAKNILNLKPYKKEKLNTFIYYPKTN